MSFRFPLHRPRNIMHCSNGLAYDATGINPRQSGRSSLFVSVRMHFGNLQILIVITLIQISCKDFHTKARFFFIQYQVQIDHLFPTSLTHIGLSLVYRS